MKLLNIVLYISLYFSLSKAQEYVIKQNDTCYDIINIFNKDTIIITKQDLNVIKSQQC